MAERAENVGSVLTPDAATPLQPSVETIRQTIIAVTWNYEQRPELLDADEWVYALRMGSVDAEHVSIYEDFPTDLPLDELKRRANAWVPPLHRIADLHQKAEHEAGGTEGYCAECQTLWPCATYHVAAGWGLDSFHDCEEEGWCSHANVPRR